MFDFLEGEILLIDKPLEWTSFQVVNKVRHEIKNKLGIKKIKVGHAGTLDPLATGLLILCTGKKTKTIDQIQQLTKEYTGQIQLGATTPSFDLETEIDKNFSIDHLTENTILAAALKLTGKLSQVPPSFSAKKINGQRAYAAARRGEFLKLAPKEIEVFTFQTDCKALPQVNFRIECSKGTYIRALARDLGVETNSGGHLTMLRRTKIGRYQVENALTINQICSLIKEN